MKKYFKKFLDSYVWLMVIIFVIDIVTKWVVFNYYKGLIGVEAIEDNLGVNIASNRIHVFPNFLNIGCTLNTGGAWSFLASDKYDGVHPALIVISIVLTAGLIFYYVKEFKKIRPLIKVSLALMISGAFGNMIDRIFYRKSITGFKGVIDWIYVDFMKFPTFNIADSALVIGVAILVVVFIIDEVKEIIEKGKRGEFSTAPNDLENKDEGNKNK